MIILASELRESVHLCFNPGPIRDHLLLVLGRSFFFVFFETGFLCVIVLTVLELIV